MPLVDLKEELKSELPVDEIIDKSGVLKKIKDKEQEPSFAESTFTAVLLTVPLILCHWLFDYLVLLQFGNEREISLNRFLSVQGKAVPAILGFALLTDYYKKSRIAQVVYFLFAIYLGRTVIMIVNDDGTYGSLQRTPGMICTGIILVIQMDLIPATVAVLGCLVFNYQKEILAMLGSAGNGIGKPEL